MNDVMVEGLEKGEIIRATDTNIVFVYNGTQTRLRKIGKSDVFDKYLKIVRRRGVKIDG